MVILIALSFIKDILIFQIFLAKKLNMIKKMSLMG